MGQLQCEHAMSIFLIFWDKEHFSTDANKINGLASIFGKRLIFEGAFDGTKKGVQCTPWIGVIVRPVPVGRRNSNFAPRLDDAPVIGNVGRRWLVVAQRWRMAWRRKYRL